MTTDKNASFRMTPELRALAERGVDDAQKTFYSVLNASQKALRETEGAVHEASDGLKDLNQHLLEATEANAAAIFSHMRDLSAADGIEEMMRLQGAFLKEQMGHLGEQARLIAEAAGKIAPHGTENDQAD
jgi:hypothetical protein